MSTELVVPSPTVEDHVDPTFSCSVVESKNCRDRRLKVEEAFVPDVAWLYLVIRTTFDQDHSKPLTVDEIRPFVRCALHALGIMAMAYNKEQGIKGMFPLKKTLSLMARWSDQTPEAREKQREEKRGYLALKHACTRIAKTAPEPKPKNFGPAASIASGRKKKPSGKRTKKGKGR